MTRVAVGSWEAGPRSPGSAAALAAQTVTPTDIGADATRLRTWAADFDLLWLLHPNVEPAPDALEALLAARDGHEGTAGILAGLVLDPCGTPSPDAAPKLAERHINLMTVSAGEGQLPIRYATGLHTLVSQEAARSAGGPEMEAYGPYAVAAWTARMLRETPGWWVTRSLATARGPLPATTGTLRQRLRVLRSGTWSRSESYETLLGLDPRR